MLCLDLFHLLEQSAEYETTVEILPLALLSQDRGIKAKPKPTIHRLCNPYELGGLFLALFYGFEYSQILLSEGHGGREVGGCSDFSLCLTNIDTTLRAVSYRKGILCFNLACGSEKCATLSECLISLFDQEQIV